MTYAERRLAARPDHAQQATPTFDPDAYYPRAYEVFSQRRQAVRPAGELSDVLLFYNKDLFDAAGVAYPDGRLDLGGRARRGRSS